MKEPNQRESWEELQERLEESNYARRTYLLSNRGLILDVSRGSASMAYRQNFEGCRELWKANYRQRRGLT